MAFNSLSDRLQMSIRRITKRSSLTEADIESMLKEIRLSLLEADVNFKVVKDFTKEIKEEALGEKILKGLNPGEQVVKIVNDKLTELLGGTTSEIAFKSGLNVFMMVGLQGAGKTTHAAKLANLYKEQGKKILLAACDIYRPAAIDQLVTLGKQIDVEVYKEDTKDAVTIAKNAYNKALSEGYDLLIIDTAGRLAIDEVLMNELKNIKANVKVDEILLTVDSMTGQDAVNVAEKFNEALNVTGAIFTKLDGDTRGGAALSIKKVTGINIKYIGVGEKIKDIEVFHPDRMASRILGMGDVLTFVESVTKNVDQDEATNLMEKMTDGTYNYDDMIKHFRMINKMGSMSKLLGMIPGMSQIKDLKDKVNDDQFKEFEVIINSMTKEERKNPSLIENSSRRRERIAKGCGKSVTEVNKLRQAFNQQAKMMKMVASGNFNANSMANMMSQRKSRGKGRSGRRMW